MKKVLVLLVLPVAIIFGACSKYKDGPKISLNTKKHRLVNSWVVEKVLESGQDQTTAYKNAYANFNLVMSKNNNYLLTYSPFGVGFYSESGSWDFFNDKNKFYLHNSDPSSSSAIGDEWTISRLKEKELWIKAYNNNGNVVELRLISQ